jgi:hypothetical protein
MSEKKSKLKRKFNVIDGDKDVVMCKCGHPALIVQPGIGAWCPQCVNDALPYPVDPRVLTMVAQLSETLGVLQEGIQIMTRTLDEVLGRVQALEVKNTFRT